MQEFREVFGAGFANKVTLYVPSTADVDRELSESETEAIIERSLHLLASRFGGATAIRAQGAWLSEGGLVVERVTLVYAFTDSLSLDDLESIKAFSVALKTELRQEAIAVEVNGVLAFV